VILNGVFELVLAMLMLPKVRRKEDKDTKEL